MPLSFQQLLWGVPLCLTLHNLEEGLGADEFVRLLRDLFPWVRFTAGRFRLGLVVLTLAVWALAFLLGPDERVAVLVVVQAALLFNAFVPHLWLTQRLRRYTPGFATALLLVLPYSLVLFSHVLFSHVP